MIEKIRQLSRTQRIKLIWLISAIAVIILLIVWALTSSFTKSVPADTSIFDTLNKGAKDLKNNYKNELP